jgi:hypothetical protein
MSASDCRQHCSYKAEREAERVPYFFLFWNISLLYVRIRSAVVPAVPAPVATAASRDECGDGGRGYCAPLRRCWRSWQRGGVWGGWAEILGVVSGGWRVEVAGWWAYLPVGLLHTPNDDDTIVVVVFAILYSGDVWGWRTGVLGCPW